MKDCPFCKAKIEDNARFCLYCMTSLDEKQHWQPPRRHSKWWQGSLAAFLAFAIALGTVWLIQREQSPLPTMPMGSESVSSASDFLTNDATTAATTTGTTASNATTGSTGFREGLLEKKTTSGNATTTTTTIATAQNNTTMPFSVNSSSASKSAATTTTTSTVENSTVTKPIDLSAFPQVGDVICESPGGEPRAIITAITINGSDSSMTIKNMDSKCETDSWSYLIYTCYDAADNPIQDIRVIVGRIRPQEERTCTFSITANTHRMTLTDAYFEWWTGGFIK